MQNQKDYFLLQVTRGLLRKQDMLEGHVCCYLDVQKQRDPFLIDAPLKKHAFVRNIV